MCSLGHQIRSHFSVSLCLRLGVSVHICILCIKTTEAQSRDPRAGFQFLWSLRNQDPWRDGIKGSSPWNTLRMTRGIIILLSNISISISLAPILPIISTYFHTYWCHPFPSIPSKELPSLCQVRTYYLETSRPHTTHTTTPQRDTTKATKVGYHGHLDVGRRSVPLPRSVLTAQPDTPPPPITNGDKKKNIHRWRVKDHTTRVAKYLLKSSPLKERNSQ